MKSPCVTYPEHEPLVLIRASQVRLCDGNHCAAALLSYFGYWHSIRLEQTQQAEHANKVAALHGELGTQETTLLQYHTEEEMEAGLLHLYGRKTIRTAIATLVSKGFVSIHSNPNPRYRFDKTHYFLFHPDTVHAELKLAVHEVKMPDREGKNTSSDFAGEDSNDSVASEHSVHEVKVPDRSGVFAGSSGKNAAPIAEITAETTEEKEEIPPIVPPGDRNMEKNQNVRKATAKESADRVATAQAKHILEYMNRVHHRTLENMNQILTLLKSKEFVQPVTMDDCKLVIDWLQDVVRVEDPEAYRKWVDSITPFRPKVFERHRDKARQWDRDGRPRGQVARTNERNHGYSDKDMSTILGGVQAAQEIQDAARRQTATDVPRGEYTLLPGPHTAGSDVQ